MDVRVRLLQKTASLKTMLSFYPSSQERCFMRTKYSELRQVQSRIDASLRLLTSADHSSSSDPQEDQERQQDQQDMHEQQPSQAVRAHRQQLVRQAELLRKPPTIRLHSLPKRQSPPATPLPEKRSLSRRQVSLLRQEPFPRPSKIYPILLSRANRDREPANASRMKEVEGGRGEGNPEDETAYEFVREERRKGEELSRLVILGKVMGENYRKGLKDLEVRRKIFRSIKVH